MARGRRYEQAWVDPFGGLRPDLWITVTDPDWPWRVRVRLGRTPDRRIVVDGLFIGALDRAEITARSLQKLSLPTLAHEITEMWKRGGTGGTSRRLRKLIETNPVYQEVTRATEAAAIRPTTSNRRHPGRKGYGSEHFERVANVYRSALGHQPMKALKKKWEWTPEATLRRWVRQAREKGYLEPIPEKAGQSKAGARRKAAIKPKRRKPYEPKRGKGKR